MDKSNLPSPDRTGRRIILALNVVLALVGAAAVASLVLEYGFRNRRPLPQVWLHIAQTVVVAIFIFDRIWRLLLSDNRLRYLRENWTDFALMLVAGAVLGVTSHLHSEVLSAGALYVIVTQVYILVALIIRGVNVNLRFADSGIHPVRLLAGSFAFLCLAGSGLLMLPAAIQPTDYTNWYYLDSLFTATSATCVTGLIVRDTGTHFTLFGQAVILTLIQLGGLGIMMFGTVMAMMVGKGLSLRGSSALGEILSAEGAGEIGRVARFVILITLGFEAVGAVMMFPMFLEARAAGGGAMTEAHAVWQSVFHAISAFCNAGFSLYGQNMTAGVSEGWSQPLRDHWQMLGVFAPLIVLGGLGFPVLQDVARFTRNALGRHWRGRWRSVPATLPDKPKPRLTLHSKIVLTTTAILLVVGAAGVWALEITSGDRPSVGRHERYRDDVAPNDDLDQMSWRRKATESVFLSVTARTAGFNTIHTDELSDASKLWVCGLMTIGGSPASTAGGLKTVTLAILVITACAVLRRRSEPETFGRSISSEVLHKTVTLAFLYLGLLAAVTLGLCVFMQGHHFIDLLFEACSACGTVGLSTGTTRHLTTGAKCVLLAGMFAGRLGPLTLILALTTSVRRVEYSYPSENIIIG